MLSHLKDVGMNYINNAKGGLNGVKVSLCVSLIFIAHTVYSHVKRDNSTEILKDNIRDLEEINDNLTEVLNSNILNLEEMKDNSTQTSGICLNLNIDSEDE